MSRVIRTALATTAAASLTVLLGATAAHADTVRHSDQRHDVQRVDEDRPGPLPGAANPDITRVTIRHGAARVTVRMAAREIDGDTFFSMARIATPSGRYDLAAIYGGGGVSYLSHRGDEDVRCAGIVTTRHTGRNVIVMSVPRHCLGTPRWVRVGAAAISAHGDVRTGHLDVAFGGRHAADENLRLSRRLHSS